MAKKSNVIKPKTTDVTSKIYDLLFPFDSNERNRVITAAFTLLGETPIAKKEALLKDNPSDSDTKGLSSQAKIWMKQNSIPIEQLEQVFHISEGAADVIVSEMPGKDIKAKTINAYVLEGISKMISSGDPNFDDESARILCKNSGCYSKANHALYIRDKGNKISGTKDAGWKLTTPGLKHGADLVKGIS